ncbi:MAG TPA: DUF763 domain-containing protein [Methanobacterium sp.]|nr:DUF763 domain-containing protein [Methanobacterium sp.]
MESRKGVVNLPLHGGHAPKWLFHRMVKLTQGITETILHEYDSAEFLRRISDPYWFQALSCVIGFDWHSSGTTTTTCGAMKMAINPEQHGIFVAGGKGRASRKTPEDIEKAGDIFSLSTSKIEELIYSSKISAKIDNSCIQDGYQLYHHSFLVDENGDWAVIQQGMNSETRYARRYHWLAEEMEEYVEEPHKGICCDQKQPKSLNMTAEESRDSRQISVDLLCDNPEHLKKYFRDKTPLKSECQTRLDEYVSEFTMPRHHPVLDMDLSEREFEVLKKAYELQPASFEELLQLDGMGPKKIRALALISDLIYGSPPSWKDPVKYNFTHGGKDGYPYPVDREVYDHSIETLKDALEGAKLEKKEKYNAIKRLEVLIN